jgi:hypothetical protein
VTLSLPPGLDAELDSAFPAESRDRTLEVAVGDVPAGDEIDLVFTLRAGEGAIGDLLAVGVSAAWTDPTADARRSIDASPRPLRRAEQPELDATVADELVAERAALQRAAAERRAGLDLDRQGRYAESRVRMRQSVDYLMAAPMTADIQFDLQESDLLAEAPANAAYGSHQRKSTQHREALRRHGRLRRDAPDQNLDQTR